LKNETKKCETNLKTCEAWREMRERERERERGKKITVHL